MDDNTIRKTIEVSYYLMDLSRNKKYAERWDKVIRETGCMCPFADAAYGAALLDWEKNSRPKDAWFSYAPGQQEDPYFLEFREELTKKFGLPVLTVEEGQNRRKRYNNIITTDVEDWGPN